MRHPSRTILSAMAALLLAGMATGAAVGADASGCQGSATSFTTSGGEIQSVTAPGPGATQDDPFQVDFDGPVTWEGSSDAGHRQRRLDGHGHAVLLLRGRDQQLGHEEGRRHDHAE